MPMGPDSFYTMLQLRGKDVAALYQLNQEQLSQGIPPHWLLYIAVESADEAAKAVIAAGGWASYVALGLGLGALAAIAGLNAMRARLE